MSTYDDESILMDLVSRAQEGDEQAQLKLIEKSKNLIMSYRRKFCWQYDHDSEFSEDLIQEGKYAVLKAIRGFDLGKGRSWWRYVKPAIRNRMSEFVRKHELAIPLPQRTSKNLRRLGVASSEFPRTHGELIEDVTVLAEKTRLTEVEVERLLKVEAPAQFSLDEPDRVAAPAHFVQVVDRLIDLEVDVRRLHETLLSLSDLQPTYSRYLLRRVQHLMRSPAHVLAEERLDSASKRAAFHHRSPFTHRRLSIALIAVFRAQEDKSPVHHASCTGGIMPGLATARCAAFARRNRWLRAHRRQDPSTVLTRVNHPLQLCGTPNLGSEV